MNFGLGDRLQVARDNVRINDHYNGVPPISMLFHVPNNLKLSYPKQEVESVSSEQQQTIGFLGAIE